MLQSLPLGLDAKDGLDQPAGDHQGGTDEVAESDLGNVPRPRGIFDQSTEEQRPGPTYPNGPQCGPQGTQAQVIVGATGLR